MTNKERKRRKRSPLLRTSKSKANPKSRRKTRKKRERKKGERKKRERKKQTRKKQKRKKQTRKKQREEQKKGSMKKVYKHKGEPWLTSDPECPKVAFHQPTIDRAGKDWIRINLTKGILKMGPKYILDDERVDTGRYIMIVMKQEPEILYLLKEFNDLSMTEYQDYEIPDDREWPTYGHSSIYSDKEYEMEWTKESRAREFEKETEGVTAKESKEKSYKRARRIRNQCLLMYAGILYYDRGIVLWTNHSGHFMPKEENKEKVGLPIELFVPTGSNEIEERLEEHSITSPPISPVNHVLETRTSQMMKSIASMMSKK